MTHDVTCRLRKCTNNAPVSCVPHLQKNSLMFMNLQQRVFRSQLKSPNNMINISSKLHTSAKSLFYSSTLLLSAKHLQFQQSPQGSQYFPSTNSSTACLHDLSSTIPREIRNSNRKRNQPSYITLGWISPNSSALPIGIMSCAQPSSTQLTSPHLNLTPCCKALAEACMYMYMQVSVRVGGGAHGKISSLTHLDTDCMESDTVFHLTF